MRQQSEVAKPPKRRRRGGQFGEMFRPEDFPELTTPSAPFRNGTIFLMARTPLLRKEGMCSPVVHSQTLEREPRDERALARLHGRSGY